MNIGYGVLSWTVPFFKSLPSLSIALCPRYEKSVRDEERIDQSQWSCDQIQM